MDLMGGRKAGEMFLHSKTRPMQTAVCVGALLRRFSSVRIVMAASIIVFTGGSDSNLHAGVDLMSERRAFGLASSCEVRIGGGFASAMGGKASITRSLRGSDERWEVNDEVFNLCMWTKIASLGLRGERERRMRGGGPESDEGLQEMLTADGDGWDAGKTEEQMSNANGGKIKSAYNFRHASHVSDFGRRGGVAASEGPGRGDDVVESDLHSRHQDQKKRENSWRGEWQVNRQTSSKQLNALSLRERLMFVTADQSSCTIHQSPVTNHQSPITSHQSPITNHQSPITPITPKRPITKH
jgi:hypothetical protein